MLDRFLSKLRSPRPSAARRLSLEHLEDRFAPAVLTVNSLLDTSSPSDGYLSLREAVAIVNSPTLDGTLSAGILAQISGPLHGGGTDSIQFDPDLSGSIVLTAGQLELSVASTTSVVTIDGRQFGATIDANSASRAFQIDGGVNATLSNLTITGGTYSGFIGGGGGISNSGTLTVNDDLFTGNHADNIMMGGGGGGIYNGSGATLTAIDSTFSGNTADASGLGGGGILNENGTLTVIGSTFSGNTSLNTGDGGGAISQNYGTMTVIDSTLSGNSARFGGGIFFGNGSGTVIGSTITNNHSDNFGSFVGGGIYTFGGLTLVSTIVAANDVGGSADINGSLAGGSIDNLIGDGTGMSGATDGVNGNLVGTSASPIDPMLGKLADNGGPTQTHAVLAGSPAIAAGGAPTSLEEGVPDGLGTTILVGDATRLAVVPGFTTLLIDGEQMLVTGITGNTLTVQRGYKDSTAAAHVSGTPVFLATDQRGSPRAFGGLTDIGAYQSAALPAAAAVQFSTASETVAASAGTFSITVTLTGTPTPTVSTFASGLSFPSSVAFDAAGNLYVANASGNTVSEVTPAGVVSTFASGFSSPNGLAFDAAGNLYVANNDSGTVSEVTPGGVVSTFASGFSSPDGLAFDAAGNLYVTNANGGTVSKVTPGGVVSTFASGFSSPIGPVFDAAGNLYVANTNAGTVSEVTPGGVVSTFASGFNQPEGLAFDAAGNLFVSNANGGTVSVVTPGGVVSTFASGFTLPEGMAINAAGDLYVADYFAGAVRKVNTRVTVPFTLGGTAVSGIDYSGVTAGTLTFAPGQASATITGTLLSHPGTSQTLTFTLGAPTGADLGTTTTNTLTITEPAADVAPTVTGTLSGQAVNDDQNIAPFGGVTVGDVDSASVTTTVTITNTADGTFTAASLTASGFTSLGGGAYHFAGSPAATTTAIRQLVFQPTQGQVAPGGTVTTNFTIVVSDGVAPSTTDAATSVVATSQPGATLPFSDSFDRADSPTLGNNWTLRVGAVGISANDAVSNIRGSIATLNGVSAADLTTQTDVNMPAGLNNFAFLVSRYGADGSFYMAGLIRGSNSVSAYIYKFSGGSFTMLGTPTMVPSGTGTLRFDVVGTSLELFFNGGLVGFANDSSLATGSTGVRGSAGATFDNYQAAVKAPTTPALPFSDPFSDAANKQLSSNWAELANGNFRVEGGVATGNAPASLAVLNGVSAADSSTQADVVVPTGLNNFASLVSRYGADGSFYQAGLIGNATGVSAYIFKINSNGSATMLGTPVKVPSGTGTLRFDVVGTSLELFFDNSLVVFANDSSLATGSTGVRGSAGATFDNYQAAVKAPTTPALPFSDPFSDAVNKQLSSNWAELANGNFRVEGGLATGNAPASLAVLNGVSAAGSSTQADVSVPAGLNNFAFLVSRYGADGSFYMAGLIRGSSGVSAYIYKFSGGSFTMLGTPAMVPSGAGMLRFDVTGSSLGLYFNNSLVDFANDSSLTTGSTGVRGSAGATFDNYSLSAS